MKHFIFLLSLAIQFALGCSNVLGQTEDDTLAIIKQANACCSKARASSLEYFGYPQFVALYKHSDKHWKNGINLIKKGALSYEEQNVFVLSMQRLDFRTYLDFIDIMYAEYCDKKIEKSILIRAVFPNLDWNTYLEEHFKDRRVIAFLQKIKNDSTLKDERGYVDYIFAGKAALDVRDLREIGQIR
jgi:hypothetical protein